MKYIIVIEIFFLFICSSCKNSDKNQRAFFTEMSGINKYVNHSDEPLLSNDTITINEKPFTFNGKEYFLLNTKLPYSGYYRIDNNNLFYLTKYVDTLKEHSESLMLNFNAVIGDTFRINNAPERPDILLKVLHKYYDNNIKDSVVVNKNDIIERSSNKYFELHKYSKNRFPDSERLYGLALSKKWGIVFFACKKNISNELTIYYNRKYLEMYKYIRKDN
jgi:hypothetical protein